MSEVPLGRQFITKIFFFPNYKKSKKKKKGNGKSNINMRVEPIKIYLLQFYHVIFYFVKGIAFSHVTWTD